MVEFNRADLRERVRIGLRIAEQFGLDVDETIQLTVPVADMVNPNLFTGFPKGAWGRTVIGAGVGDAAQCIIQSAPDRGIVYHVTRMYISGVVTGQVRLRVGDADISGSTDFALSAIKQFTDTRDTGVPDCAIAQSAPLLAGVDGSPVQIYDVSADLPRVYELDVVLGGDGFLLLENMTLNETLDVSWRWTEYLLEDR